MLDAFKELLSRIGSSPFHDFANPIDYKQNTHSSTMLKNQSRSREFVPNIVLTNVMSLLPKIDEIRVFTETHSIDLFFISETWLKSNVGDDQLILPGYNLERLDRRIGIHGKNAFSFSDDLRWSTHVLNIIKKANKIISYLAY